MTIRPVGSCLPSVRDFPHLMSLFFKKPVIDGLYFMKGKSASKIWKSASKAWKSVLEISSEEFVTYLLS